MLRRESAARPATSSLAAGMKDPPFFFVRAAQTGAAIEGTPSPSPPRRLPSRLFLLLRARLLQINLLLILVVLVVLVVIRIDPVAACLAKEVFHRLGEHVVCDQDTQLRQTHFGV